MFEPLLLKIRRLLLALSHRGLLCLCPPRTRVKNTCPSPIFVGLKIGGKQNAIEEYVCSSVALVFLLNLGDSNMAGLFRKNRRRKAKVTKLHAVRSDCEVLSLSA